MDSGAFHELEPVGSAEASASKIWLTPKRALSAFTLLVLSAFTAVTVVFNYTHSHFYGDDIITMIQLHEQSLGAMMLTPLNEHFAPLHRLVCYLLDVVAPMSFGAAQLVLLAFHALGLVYLYRLLWALEQKAELAPAADAQHRDDRRPEANLLRSPVSWLLFGLYGTYVFSSVLFLWWSSGLHRLPFIACSLMAIFYYLKFRDQHRFAPALKCALCSVAGLFFYAKGMLIPLYLVAVELSFWTDTSWQERRKNARLLLPMLLALGVYASIWRHIQPTRLAVNLDWAFQRDFLLLSWSMLRDSVLGTNYDAHDVAQNTAAYAVWLLPVGYTIVRRPSNVLTWLGLAVLLAGNVLMTSLSKSRGILGISVAAFALRYYMELFFLVIVFAALAFSRVRRTPRPTSSWLAAGACMLALSAVALQANATMRFIYAAMYSSHAQSRAYLTRVASEVERLTARGRSIAVREGMVPSFVVPFPNKYRKISALLRLMRANAVVRAAGPGLYRIKASGQLVAPRKRKKK